MPEDLGIYLINFHRYERYEGKNLSDALGSLLKRKMRSGALQNRVFGSKQDYMQRMLYEIEDDTDLEDLVFDSKEDAFTWLKMCMKKPEDSDFSKRFKQIEMVWVDKVEMPVDLVVEKEVKKIPQIKSFNMGTSIAWKSGVMMRDNSCVCKECQAGNVLDCTDEKNGSYISFDLRKGNKNRTTEKKRGKKSVHVIFLSSC